MRISDCYGRSEPVYSFEFFPPKTDEGAVNLMATVADLKQALAPDFVSVTCGAMGTTRTRTLEVVTRIQREIGITSMAHQTCIASSREHIAEVIGQLVDQGIQNVLALRGDPPKDGAGEGCEPGAFRYASELIEFLAEHYDLDLGAACYPEGHVESPDPDQDLRWTCEKVRLGAGFLITQLFFDNAHYFAFVARARAAGIRVPIVPGIMPITNVAQIERFTKLCGATIPAELSERLQRVADDPGAVMATGIEQAIGQCRELLEKGAPGVHFYTLNKSHATRSLLAALRRI